MDIAKAYAMGRNAAARGGKVEGVQFEKIASPRMAEALQTAFIQGMRDVHAENRINQED